MKLIGENGQKVEETLDNSSKNFERGRVSKRIHYWHKKHYNYLIQQIQYNHIPSHSPPSPPLSRSRSVCCLTIILIGSQPSIAREQPSLASRFVAHKNFVQKPTQQKDQNLRIFEHIFAKMLHWLLILTSLLQSPFHHGCQTKNK